MKANIGSKLNPQIIWVEITDYTIVEYDSCRPNMFCKVDMHDNKKPVWFNKSNAGNWVRIGKPKLSDSNNAGWEWWTKTCYILK